MEEKIGAGWSLVGVFIILADETANFNSSRAGQWDNSQGFIGFSHAVYGTLTFGRTNSLSQGAEASYDPVASVAFSPQGFSVSLAGSGPALAWPISGGSTTSAPALSLPRWLRSRTAAVALVGFALNLGGALGSAFWLDPAEGKESEASREALAEAARSRAILAANALDELAMHTGSLVFGVSTPPNASDDVATMLHDIRTRALMRRHDGVRGYLAVLGVAGAIDYPAEKARYEALVEAERAHLTLETYRAANAFEGDLSMAMVKAQGGAAMKAITLQRDRMRAKAVVAQRKQALLGVSLIGSTILFLATMVGATKAVDTPSAKRRLLALAAARLADRSAAP